VGDHPDQAKLDADRAKRAALYGQTWDLIVPEAWYVYLAHANYVSAARTRVHNWTQYPTSTTKYTTLWLG
jgi:ABC-type transport system substrate-binding protein